MKLTQTQLTKLEKVLNGRKATTEQLEFITEGIKTLMEVCGRPLDAETEESPFRILKAYLELTDGYCEDASKHLNKLFDVDVANDVVLVKDIPFNSLCSHHALPFFGKVHIAYVPKNKVTGLSKFGRLVDGYSHRFQTQEVLTKQIANAIEDVLDTSGVMVIVTGEHMCMSLRGIKKMGAETTTIYSSGCLDTHEKRNEVIDMINLHKGLIR